MDADICGVNRLSDPPNNDLLVEAIVLIELKAARMLDAAQAAQCINYLKATGLHLCLLLNSGNSRLDIRRAANGL
jgi:GxxExxY protein